MSSRRKTRKPEEGYVLLMLILFVALLAIAAAAIAPSVSFQAKRDREEEMIHRGVQYSRAVRAYYKKFGRYPTRLEDLENTNNLRFLRRRYKDPITGQDFKLLHYGEVQFGVGGASIAGATPAGALNQSPATQAGLAAIAQAQQQFAAANQPATNINKSSDDSDDATKSTDKADDSAKNNSTSQDKLSGTTFGGGPIVGVVSTSKDKSIRVFNKKNHYDKWQFIYDPSTDRGGLLNTPNQPPLQGTGTVQTPGGAPGTQGGNPSANPPAPQPQQQQPPEPQ